MVLKDRVINCFEYFCKLNYCLRVCVITVIFICIHLINWKQKKVCCFVDFLKQNAKPLVTKVFLIMAFADGNIVIKEGYLELQKGKNAFRTFNRRYMIVRKNGIVDLFEKEEHRDNENKRKESFQMQGGEEIVIAKVYQNRFRFKVIVDDHKKKNPTKWCFGFESETAQKSWLSVFQGVLKQLVKYQYTF